MTYVTKCILPCALLAVMVADCSDSDSNIRRNQHPSDATIVEDGGIIHPPPGALPIIPIGSPTDAAVVDGAVLGHDASAPLAFTHHVGLVIEFTDRILTKCIDIQPLRDGGHVVTGEDILRASGLPLVTAEYGGAGTAICKIDDTGCSANESCFCRTSPILYWSYWFRVTGENQWRYSGLGATEVRHAGDVDLWAWGDSYYDNYNLRTPLISFEEICR